MMEPIWAINYIICNAKHGWFGAVVRLGCCDAASLSAGRDLKLPATIIREREKTVFVGEVLGTRDRHAARAGAAWR